VYNLIEFVKKKIFQKLQPGFQINFEIYITKYEKALLLKITERTLWTPRALLNWILCFLKM